VLEAFIARYKDTFYADLARARMDDLKRQQLAAAASPKVSATPKAAEPAVATTPSASPPPPMAAQPFTLASPITLKLQDTFPATDPSSRDHLNTVLRDLTALSGGTLKVDLLPAGTVVPGFQVLEAVAKGTPRCWLDGPIVLARARQSLWHTCGNGSWRAGRCSLRAMDGGRGDGRT
jgi:hypothetical protein